MVRSVAIVGAWLPCCLRLKGPLLGTAVIGSSAAAASAILSCALVLVDCLAADAYAQSPFGADAPAPDFEARKIFFMLFLMLGPIKILVPFVAMTRGSDRGFRRRLATRATLFAAAALALAGVLGRLMLESFAISLPVLAMTGGIILFLVALQTVLQQSAGAFTVPQKPDPASDIGSAFTPLAFPTIVTPYGIAAVIVFATLATGRHDQEFTVAGIVLAILLLDWLAMLYAETIFRWTGTTLQIFAVVLSVTQAALGLQLILKNLSLIGAFAGSSS